MTIERPEESAYAVRDPEALAHNLARVFEEVGKAASAYLKPREEGKLSFDSDSLTDVIKTLTRLGEYWMSDPERTVEAEHRLWSGYFDLWTASVKRMMGEPVEPVVDTDPRDRRFTDPDWRGNHFFDFIRQVYLITSHWAVDLAEQAAGLDPHTRQKASFYVKQIANALAPSNFVLTNPELLRETLSSNAENLVRGMHMLAEDIRAGGGDLRIRQTSPGNFALGENLATTPGEVIYQNELCQIIRYDAVTEKVLARPLVIVPPWINKFYVLDLTPEKSFIRWCVEQGQTVFVISWVNPDKRHARKGFEEYMKEGVIEAVDVACKATGADGVNAVGYCVGGTILSITLAWMAARGDDRIKSATLFATQVDFRQAGDLKVFVDEEQLADLEYRMKMRGYLEGKDMAAAFNMLRPNDLIWPYVIGNYFKGKQPQPFDLLYWNSDSTRMPAANHSYYLRNCYLENNLSQGKMNLAGRTLSLSDVTIPIYNLASREDHIAPARSAFLGSRYFGGDVEFVMAGSGHIAGVVNPPSMGKYQHWTGGKPVGEFDDWVASATENPGSWWPHWHKWIEKHNKQKVAARKPGANGKPLGEAPGTYVTVRV